MHLELKRDPSGMLRHKWYGAAQIGGRRRVITLCRWQGTPPASKSVADYGDTEFERSRERALTELKAIVEGERSEADAAALAERVHRGRYGHTVEAVKLSDLPSRWDAIPRKRKASAFHAENCHRALQRFVDFMAEHAPRVKDLGAVSADNARAYFDSRADDGISARTWNWELSLIRGMFARLDPHAAAYRDYLKATPSRDESTVHKEPFSPDELARVFDAAADDDLLRPLIACCACTAMRRGDVARLRWRSVNLETNFITVKTTKTNKVIEIPIFPALRDELLHARKDAPDARPDAFVWPEAARLYKHAPDALDRRLKTIMARAGFFTRPEGAPDVPALSESDTRARVESAIDAAPDWTDKRRDHARKIFALYMDGSTGRETAAALGITPGLVSMRLNELERLAGCAIVRRPAMPDTVAAREETTPRARRGSVRGWHSFRVTWITLALSAGVPMELVRVVSGHSAAETVLKHYFRPGRADMAKALTAAMPAALTHGDPTPITEADELAMLAGKNAAGTATKQEKNRLRALAAKV